MVWVFHGISHWHHYPQTFLLAVSCGLLNLSSPTRDWTRAMAVKAQNSNHQGTPGTVDTLGCEGMCHCFSWPWSSNEKWIIGNVPYSIDCVEDCLRVCPKCLAMIHTKVSVKFCSQYCTLSSTRWYITPITHRYYSKCSTCYNSPMRKVLSLSLWYKWRPKVQQDPRAGRWTQECSSREQALTHLPICLEIQVEADLSSSKKCLYKQNLFLEIHHDSIWIQAPFHLLVPCF